MAGPVKSRAVGELTFQEVGTALRASSVLCLPVGSMEQHGPHLPLETDGVLAEAFTRLIVERFGEVHDLWRLPPLAVGLSREHGWAPGTLSLSVAGMTGYLRDLAREIVRALPARNLLLVNGHGGNRGILEALGRELRADFGLNVCTLQLGALISPATGAAIPEIHAGKDETSVMLALAPALVRREWLAGLNAPDDGAAIRALILDPAASFAWSSDDRRIAAAGVIGDAREASAEHGRAIVERVVEAAGQAIARLRENQDAVKS
jgi:creatinine amidohydrolase/Fe(II)-dependent formamide hydrolase-like protein